MGKNKVRSLRLRRGQQTTPNTHLSIEAIERLIHSQIEPLQNQVKILQSNAITSMVILGDIQNSVTLAASSTESSKRTLQEFLVNLGEALTNTAEFIGRPQQRSPNIAVDIGDRTLLQNLIDEVSEGIIDMDSIDTRRVDPEELRQGILNYVNQVAWGTGTVDDEEAMYEDDGIVENVSEEYEDYEENETEVTPARGARQARASRSRNRRRRT